MLSVEVEIPYIDRWGSLTPPALECNRTVGRVVTDNCLNKKLYMLYIDQIYAIMPQKTGKCNKVLLLATPNKNLIIMLLPLATNK